MQKILFWGGNFRTIKANRSELMESLHQRGWEVHAVIPNEAIDFSEVPSFLALHMLNDNNKSLNPFLLVRVAIQALQLCKNINPEVSFCYNFRSILLCSIVSLFSRGFSTVVLITGLGSIFSRRTFLAWFFRIPFRFLYFFCLRASVHVIFQNRDDLNDLKFFGRLGKSYTVVGGSGVNLRDFSQRCLPTEAGVCMVARPLADKGVAEFLAAAAVIFRLYPNVKFTLVGDISTGKRFEIDPKIVERLSNLGNVHLTGKVMDVRPYLEKCSIFVLPSYYREGLPRAGLEAMATGRAIIAANSTGTRELVYEDFNGFLVEARSVDSLVKRIIYLIENPEMCLSFGRNSRKLAEARFDVFKVNLKIIEIIENAA